MSKKTYQHSAFFRLIASVRKPTSDRVLVRLDPLRTDSFYNGFDSQYKDIDFKDLVDNILDNQEHDNYVPQIIRALRKGLELNPDEPLQRGCYEMIGLIKWYMEGDEIIFDFFDVSAHSLTPTERAEYEDSPETENYN